ncbi:hypothetical protein BPAE_0094g00170 [Botrytis paeoniae]|uniref:Uncharacterized protein n=1 Tax=Botrytis paeoniae TaxID=278948 RepID=A0A4Z1FMY9_9HELO|nr:hypothetical protein BPAE_0094g00170 [Botrytis paeoniae]
MINDRRNNRQVGNNNQRSSLNNYRSYGNQNNRGQQFPPRSENLNGNGQNHDRITGSHPSYQNFLSTNGQGQFHENPDHNVLGNYHQFGQNPQPFQGYWNNFGLYNGSQYNGLPPNEGKAFMPQHLKYTSKFEEEVHQSLEIRGRQLVSVEFQPILPASLSNRDTIPEDSDPDDEEIELEVEQGHTKCGKKSPYVRDGFINYNQIVEENEEYNDEHHDYNDDPFSDN